MTSSQADTLAARLGYEPRDPALFVAGAHAPQRRGAQQRAARVPRRCRAQPARVRTPVPRIPDGERRRPVAAARAPGEQEPLAEVAASMQLGECCCWVRASSRPAVSAANPSSRMRSRQCAARCISMAASKPCATLIGPMFEPRIAALPDAATLKDAKTRLQEHLQANGRPLPRLRGEAHHGEPHAQTVPGVLRIAARAVETEGEGPEPAARRAERPRRRR